MHFPVIKPLAAMTLGAGLLFVPGAHAHEAGDVLLKVGVSHVMPKSDNGSVVDGTVGLDIGNSTRPSFSLTYMATKHVGIELLGALPFQHHIDSDLGTIGKTKHLPPTLSVQWHFLPDAKVQPYVGVGLNYTHFFDTHAQGALAGSDLKLKDSWGAAAQVGVDIPIDKKWFVNADVRYIHIKSDVKLDGAHVGTTKVNPWVATVAVGYRF